MNLRFDQAELKKETDNPEPGCTVAHETLVRKGNFRGRIKLDDRKGFGLLSLGTAPGTILHFPAETCPLRKDGVPKGSTSSAAEEEAPVDSPGALSSSLHTDRKLDGGELGFDAETYPNGPFGDKDAPRFEFTASFSKTRYGLSTFASAITPLTTN